MYYVCKLRPLVTLTTFCETFAYRTLPKRLSKHYAGLGVVDNVKHIKYVCGLSKMKQNPISFPKICGTNLKQNFASHRSAFFFLYGNLVEIHRSAPAEPISVVT